MFDLDAFDIAEARLRALQTAAPDAPCAVRAPEAKPEVPEQVRDGLPRQCPFHGTARP